MLTNRREAMVDIILAAVITGMFLFSGCGKGLNIKETKIIFRHNNLCRQEYEQVKDKYPKDQQEAIEDRYQEVTDLLQTALEEK